ncbi:MAG: hypothetical protein LUG65_07795 [Clostridiales bacterium]|nr:hypothetical protein [Clostridiales bacterium]
MESTLDRAKINQAGVDLQEDVAKMYQSLENVKDLIDKSSSYFDSKAGKTLRTKFSASAEQFETFRSYLNDYGEYLKTFSKNVGLWDETVEEVVNGIPTL